MNTFLDKVRDAVRAIMRVVARGLNKLSGGKLSPNAVTIVGLLAHLPIAYLISEGRLGLSAILLVIFGLFDTLDGELARLQKRDNPAGMFLDSVTDRMKEVFLYVGIAFYLVSTDQAFYAVWAIAALGGSVLTSYVNAWGDVVMSKALGAAHKTNRAIRGGLLRFEVRMFLLVLALAFGRLPIFVVAIGTLSFVTVLQRMGTVLRSLRHVQD